MIGGPFFIGLALALGATRFQVGLMFSIISLSFLLSPLAALIIERLGRPRDYAAFMMLSSRLIRSLRVLVPFLLPVDWWVWGLLGFSFLSVLLMALGQPGWMTLMGDLVPGEMRGRFFGRRSAVIGLVGMVAALLAGQILDRVTGAPQGFPPDYNGFLVIYALALCILAVEAWAWSRVPEPGRRRPAKRVNFRRLWKLPFGHTRFMWFTAFVCAWTFAQGIAGPFYAVFMLEELRISYSTIAILQGVNILAMILTYPLWGYLSDRFGHATVLRLGAIGIAATPLLWVSATPGHLIPLGIVHLLMGVSMSAFNLGTTNVLLGTMPEQHRAVYPAIHRFLTAFPSVAAPLVGGVLAERFPVSGTAFAHLFEGLAGASPGHLRGLFLCSGALVVLALVFLFRFGAEKDARARDVLRAVSRRHPLATAYRLFRLRRARSASDRAAAVRDLGVLASPLATDALVRALDDPNPDVRRQAAISIGESRDPAATAALLSELDDPEVDTRPEVIRALGRVGSAEAVPHLIRLLRDPDWQVRISSMAALGRIGGTEATQALIEMAGTLTRNHYLFAASIDALAKLREPEAIEIALDAYPEFVSPIIRRQLLCSVSEVLGVHPTYYRLVGQEPYARDANVTGFLRELRHHLEGRASPLPERDRDTAGAALETAEIAYQQGARIDAVRGLMRLAKELRPALGPDAALALDVFDRLSEVAQSGELDQDQADLALIALAGTAGVA